MTSSRSHRPPYKGGASTITGYTADLPPLYNIMDLMNGSKPALHNPYNGTYSAEMYSKEAVNIIKQYATHPTPPPPPPFPPPTLASLAPAKSSLAPPASSHTPGPTAGAVLEHCAICPEGAGFIGCAQRLLAGNCHFLVIRRVTGKG